MATKEIKIEHDMAPQEIEVLNGMGALSWKIRIEKDYIKCISFSKAPKGKNEYTFAKQEGRLYLFNSSMEKRAYFRDEAFAQKLEKLGVHSFHIKCPNREYTLRQNEKYETDGKHTISQSSDMDSSLILSVENSSYVIIYPEIYNGKKVITTQDVHKVLNMLENRNGAEHEHHSIFKEIMNLFSFNSKKEESEEKKVA